MCFCFVCFCVCACKPDMLPYLCNILQNIEILGVVGVQEGVWPCGFEIGGVCVLFKL